MASDPMIIGSRATQTRRRPMPHTFKVDHHRMSTDPMMVMDEVSKCAYRENKSSILVACTELAETRADYIDLRDRVAIITREIYANAKRMKEDGEPGSNVALAAACAIAIELGFTPWKD